MVPMGIQCGAFLGDQTRGDSNAGFFEDRCRTPPVPLIRIGGTINHPTDPRGNDRHGAGWCLPVGGAGLECDIKGRAVCLCGLQFSKGIDLRVGKPGGMVVAFG